MVRLYVNRIKDGIASGKYRNIEEGLADVPERWREAVREKLEDE